MYALAHLGDTAVFDEKTVTGQVKDFHRVYTRTRALAARVIELSNAEMLSRRFFDSHMQLLQDFRNLYVELYAAFTPAQQHDVAMWLMDVTPKMANVRTRKLLSGLDGLGVLPLVIPVVLVIGGVVTTIMVTKVIADALAAYNAELSRQEKEAAFVASVQKDVRDEVVTFDQGLKLLQEKARGVIPESTIIKAQPAGGGIFDIIGTNLTTLGLVALLAFVLIGRK